MPTASAHPPTRHQQVADVARRGWSWGLDYAWIVSVLADGLIRSEPPAHYAEGEGHPVLLLPGVYEEWSVMRQVADRLNDAGHPIHVLSALGRNTMGIVEAARLAEAYLADRDLRGVVIVAHSKGGLIGKQLLASPGERTDPRVRRVVAVATPFAGSKLARLIPTPVVQSLGPGDPTIIALAARTDVNHLITSICPAFDPHIPGGSFLEGATNVPVLAMGHFRVLADPAVLDAVALATADPLVQ